jgi:hypothetical protein
MDECPICYEKINLVSKTKENKLNFYKTNCNHRFHKSCFKEWVNSLSLSNKKYTCPLCREKVDVSLIIKHNKLINRVYKTKNIKRKTKLINDTYVSIIYKTLQDQIPKAWIYFNNNDYILSLYQLNINSENTYISAYFRCYLLYSNKIEDIKSYDVYDFNGNKYLDLDERKYKITETFIKPVFLICFKWCIEVLHTFKYYYSFNYQQYYNTILNDLAIYTILNLNYCDRKGMYQAVYASAMYNIIQFFNNQDNQDNRENNNLPDVYKLVYMTDFTYTVDQLKPIISFQKDYLDKNILLLTQ